MFKRKFAAQGTSTQCFMSDGSNAFLAPMIPDGKIFSYAG